MRYVVIVMAGLAMIAAGQPSFSQATQRNFPSDKTAATLFSPREEAMQRFNRAVRLYEEHDYAAALVEFRRAYKLAPTYKLLYQIGQVSYRLHDYAGALQAFEQYLREGGEEISAQRRAEVQEEIALVKLQTGKIEISTNMFGATVTIDDVAVGSTPLESAVVVSIGKRKVTLMAEGRQSVTRIVSVSGQELVKLNIELPLIRAKSEKKTVDEGKSLSKMTTLSWLGVGATASFTLGAAVTGVMALNASKKMSDMSYIGTKPSGELEDQRRKVKHLALGCDLLAGAAVVTLATTLVLTYTRPDPVSEQTFVKTYKKTASEACWRPLIGAGSVGLFGAF